MTTVAVLGTGRMGSAMARALAGAGLQVVLWNRSPEPARSLAAELAAEAVATPADAAQRAAICLTMLADEAAVAATYGGPDGLIAAVDRPTSWST